MRERSYHNRTGEVHGRLTVLGVYERRPNGKLYWLCQCACGNRSIVRSDYIHITLSCGCLQREAVSKASSTHRQSKTALYKIWTRMKQCCYNSKSDSYEFYGARGIKLANEWLDFETFREWSLAHGYEKGKHIHRIDKDCDYTPANCVWLSRAEHYAIHAQERQGAPIIQMDKKTLRVIKLFYSWGEVNKAFNDSSTIRRAIRVDGSAYGYKWARLKGIVI